MPTSNGLPDYDPALKAYHAAFAPELEAAVRRYELGPSARVLDSPCGDGFYTNLFAGHMRSGTLVAADLSPAYLDLAKAAVGPAPPGPTLEFVKADAYNLPFDDASFDLVWCAEHDQPCRPASGDPRDGACWRRAAGSRYLRRTSTTTSCCRGRFHWSWQFRRRCGRRA